MKNKLDYETIRVRSGCLSIAAIAISIFFLLGAFVGGGVTGGQRAAFLTISGVAATVAIVCYLAQDKMKKKEQQAEQERLEREEKEKQEKQAQLEIERENAAKAIEEFKSNLDIALELKYIFSVIKDNPTTEAFEQGVDNLIKKNNISIPKSDVLTVLLNTMVENLVGNKNHLDLDDTSPIIVSRYFASGMKDVLFGDYLEIAMINKRANATSSASEVYAFTEMSNKRRIPFVKNLHGFAVRAWNYVYHLDNGETYSSVSDEMLIDLIENSSVIKSYWESNPFEADERKKEWLEDIRKAAYKAVDKSKLGFEAEGNEIVLDMLCYMGYRAITQKDGKHTAVIVTDIYECIKTYCEELVERVG